MNRIRLALVEGRNPAHGEWDPDLPLDPSIATVDVALIEGPLLADGDFINDYSEAVEDAERPGLRRYRSLADHLGAESIEELREVLEDLLGGLAADLGCGPSWVLWLPRKCDEDDLDNDYSYYSAEGSVVEGDMNINGRVTIVEVKRDDLGCYREHFGECDSIVGLAAPEGAIQRVLHSLSLACPWPTIRKYSLGRMTCEVEAEGLAAILEIENSLFFEEYDNGTRLRLASKAVSAERLRQAVVERLGGLAG